MIYKALLECSLHSRTQNGESDEITHKVQAMVAVHDDGSWTVRYHDAANKGQTALSGSTGWMTISRDGSVQSKMRFVPSRLEAALYVTPYGEFEMATMTDALAVTVTSSDGHLQLNYDLLINGELTAQNQLEVRWTKI